MIYWISFIVIISLLYSFLILYYYHHWEQIERVKIANVSDPISFVSVIIVGRNEEDNIPGCLESIKNNSFPKEAYEIIYVDDHSEDDSLEILNKLKIPNLIILRLEDHITDRKINSYKKEAINYAVSKSKGDLIIQTDADTIVKKDWLKFHYNSWKNNGRNFSAGPVFLLPEKSFLSWFQSIDVLTTMGITGAAISSELHYLANGANMSFSKKEYLAIRMDESIKMASGDDIFLIQEMAGINKAKIGFIREPNAAVLSFGEKNWTSFFKQRRRWASKSKAYKDRKLQLVAVVVFVMNVLLIANLCLFIASSQFLYIFLALLLGKSIIDMIFIQKIASYYQSEIPITYLIISMLFYPVYYLLTGLSSLLPGKYEWKKRKVN